MSVELQCTAAECDSGEDGQRWKSQPLPDTTALQMLDRHLLVVHGQQVHQVGGGGQHRDEGGGGGVIKSKWEKIPRPTISTGCTQQDFNYFLEQWKRYKRGSGDGDSDTNRLRDQLMYCPDEALRRNVSRSLGERLDTISEEALLEEIKRLAVERQSNIINTVALLSVTQDRDEGVRQFAARLRGLAAVCDFSLVCNCGIKMSGEEKWMLMAMVKGLNDEDTKQEVMSKVKEMSLDETIAFVEARETGKKSINTLNGGVMASSQLNRINTSYKDQGLFLKDAQEKCKYCGTQGHGKNPNFDLKKAKCPAFNNKCHQCNRKGHFQDFCNHKHDKEKPGDAKNKVGANSVKLSRVHFSSQKQMKHQNISKTYLNLVKMQRNMTKLGYEEWSESLQTYVETEVPKDPQIKFKMCVDVKVYAKHKPPLDCLVEEDWYNSLVDKQNMSVELSATADSGAQVDVIGTDHLRGLGLRVSLLLRSRMTINCANNNPAGNLGVFFAKIKATHYKTGELIETKSMVFVIEGDTVLLSKRTLRVLGCIDDDFPQVGKWLNSAGAKKMNCPTQAPQMTEHLDPGNHDRETNPPLRQPPGECDPESEIPCSCPRRTFTDPPTHMPMPATDSNRKALEDYLKEYFKSSAFNTCKRQSWPITAGQPMRMHTTPDAVPVYHRKPTKVPLHFREEVRAGLEADVKKGILRRVPQGEPDNWCARMVIQPKKNGRARRTVDLSGLSRASTHESHHTRTAAEIAKTVPARKLKTTLDIVDGYHGVELAEEDRHKTTFATEWGLFQYCRVPQGYLSSGDSYTKHTDAIMESCPGKPEKSDYEKIIDDTIVWSDNIEEAFFRIAELLSHCNQNGMVFSPDKFEFAKQEVEFAGFKITMEGIKPTDKYIEAIRNFPTPKNISDVRSWYGLINQVAYAFIKTEHMAPFRKLLSPATMFEWTEELDDAFRKSKEKIIELIVDGVKSFDPNLITCLSPDFSKQGMGWILQQKRCSCEKIKPTCCPDGWSLVLAGGKFCSKTEENYSPVEGEAMAVAKGLEDTKYYTLGCQNLYVATDHSSLVKILGDQSLADVQNPRLARIKERTMWWKFKIIHTPGKSQLAADAISRRNRLPTSLCYLSTGYELDDEEEIFTDMEANIRSVGANVHTVMQTDRVNVITWDILYEETQRDPVMIKLVDMIIRGFPASSYDMPLELRQFFKFRHDLHTVGGVACYKDRVIIPAKLRRQVLETIHAAHQGVSGMISRVEESVFWPGITPDIIKTRNTCMTCIKEAPSQPAGAPIAPPTPAFPFQYIVADYCSVGGRNFLVIGDRFSGWLSIYEAGEGAYDAKSLVKQLRDWCQMFNIPEEISTDGGPQMTSSIFQEALKSWGIRHRLSSSYYAHSNCRAELSVKTGKRLLRENMGSDGSLNNNRFMRAIMQFRNTPMQDCRRSPAQMVFGRQLRDFIPSLLYKFAPAKDWITTQEYRERTLAKKRESDGLKWSAKTRHYGELDIGTPVAIQNQTGSNPTKWDKTGVVIENKPHSQILIRVDGSRRTTLRNRKFVRPLDPDVHRPVRRSPVESHDIAPVLEEENDLMAEEDAPETLDNPVGEERSGTLESNLEIPDEDVPVAEEVPQGGVDDNQAAQPNGGDVGDRPKDGHVEERPKRMKRHNKKYDPDVFDLSYIGHRRKSRKSVRRAVYGHKDPLAMRGRGHS